MIFDRLFGKSNASEGKEPKVLVAYFESRFESAANSDFACYSKYYAFTKIEKLNGAADLCSILEGLFDIVHLLAEIAADGQIVEGQGRQSDAAAMLEKSLDRRVALMWIAGESVADHYLKGFRSIQGKPLNLILTLNRKGDAFSQFLESLLSKLATGEKIASAWVAVAPQNSGDPRNAAAPECIFVAGLPKWQARRIHT